MLWVFPQPLERAFWLHYNMADDVIEVMCAKTRALMASQEARRIQYPEAMLAHFYSSFSKEPTEVSRDVSSDLMALPQSSPRVPHHYQPTLPHCSPSFPHTNLDGCTHTIPKSQQEVTEDDIGGALVSVSTVFIRRDARVHVHTE